MGTLALHRPVSPVALQPEAIHRLDSKKQVLLISGEIWIHRSSELSLGFWGSRIEPKLAVLSSCELRLALVSSQILPPKPFHASLYSSLPPPSAVAMPTHGNR